MLTVLFRNDELAIVVKPRGVSVQPGEKAGRTILDMAKEEWGIEPRLIHRLDRDTEGALAIALTREAAAAYSRVIDSPDCDKTYEAVVKGALPGESGFIDDEILQKGTKKSAGTEWKALRRWDTAIGPVSLVRLSLATGRMHQIRIHLAGLGNPIIADDRHGDFKFNKEAKRAFGARHLMLFARSLRLGEAFAEAPVPAHFADLYARLDAAEGTVP